MPTERLPERVTGPRVALRRWRVDDVDVLAAAVERNVDHLAPWMPWIANEPLARAARVALLEEWDRAWADGGDVRYGIFLGGEVVGGTGLHRRRGPHGLEIGYWVDAGHLRRGIATEAAGVLTCAALGLEGITFVEIHHDKANVASSRVPPRLGYGLVGESPRPPSAPGDVGIDCAWRATAPPAAYAASPGTPP